jgi:hypothetical protein
MLRHSAGYTLAGEGHDTRRIQDYLGHRNIGNTVRYRAVAGQVPGVLAGRSRRRIGSVTIFQAERSSRDERQSQSFFCSKNPQSSGRTR